MKYRGPIILILASAITIAVVALFGWNASRSGRAEESPPILQYPAFPPTPTVAPAPTAGLSVAGANVLAADSFDTADALSRWEIVDPGDVPPEDRSVWAVQDGALVENRTANAGNPNIQETMAVTGGPLWTDYTVTAKVYDQNNGNFGLVTRRQGNSFYRYQIIANQLEGTPKQTLEKVVDGVATPLVTHEQPGYDQRQWHTVSMSVVGSRIRVTFDGAVVAEATDSTLTSGQAGLYTRALGGIRFDDVAIAKP